MRFFAEGFANAIIRGLYVVPQMLAIANKDGWSKNEKKHAKGTCINDVRF